MAILSAASAVAVVALVGLAVALAPMTTSGESVRTPPSPVRTEDAAKATGPPRVQEYGQDGAPGSVQRRTAYREAVAAFPWPLPDGYAFPSDGESTSESGDVVVLQHWIAATADAARRAQEAGNAIEAERLTEELSVAWATTIRPTLGPNVEYIGQAIDEHNFSLLLQAFPLPSGMARS